MHHEFIGIEFHLLQEKCKTVTYIWKKFDFWVIKAVTGFLQDLGNW